VRGIEERGCEKRSRSVEPRGERKRNNRKTAEYRSTGKHGNTEETVISEENYYTGRESKLCGFGGFK
jgi:hypothetical protein